MYLDFTCLHAAIQELPANSFNVVDDNLKSFLRSRSHLGDAYSHHYRACRSRRGELDEAQLLVDLVIVVQPEADLIDVERFGAVDIDHGQWNEFEFHVHASNLVAYRRTCRSVRECQECQKCPRKGSLRVSGDLLLFQPLP
jgi:hypothetical protein